MMALLGVGRGGWAEMDGRCVRDGRGKKTQQGRGNVIVRVTRRVELGAREHEFRQLLRLRSLCFIFLFLQ